MEIWKAINGYEGLYEISSYGRVKSFKRKHIIIRKPGLGSSGYLHVTLRKKGHLFTCKVHRLVAETFIINKNEKKYVNHINGNKQNNCIDNLEWCTSSENTLHAFRTGLRKGLLGVDNPAVKLIEGDVLQIRYLEGCLTRRELAAVYGVSKEQICGIHQGKRWAHVKVSSF